MTTEGMPILADRAGVGHGGNTATGSDVAGDVVAFAPRGGSCNSHHLRNMESPGDSWPPRFG